MDSQLNNGVELKNELKNTSILGDRIDEVISCEPIAEQQSGLTSKLCSNNRIDDSRQIDIANSPNLDETKSSPLYQANPSLSSAANASRMDNPFVSSDFVNSFTNQQVLPTPFINLDSLFPANVPGSSDAGAHLTDSRTLLNDRTIPTNVQPFSVANLTPNIDCSIAANDSINTDGSVSKPKKRRRRGRKRKNSNGTANQSANASKDPDLIDNTPDQRLVNPVALDKQPANAGDQPPLINYDSTDQGADESSDSDRPSYTGKRKRARPASHSAAQVPENDHRLSDSEFEHYYSQENLYSSRKYFNNKKYRISVQRYGNEIRVFQPICIVKRSHTLLLKVLGLYCLNASKMSADQPVPPGFIWPLNFGKHEENVATIRRLIKENPVDDQLPYVDIDETAIDLRPFSPDADEQENRLHRVCQRANFVGRAGGDEEPDENDENSDKLKHSFGRLEKLSRSDSDAEAGDSKCQSKSSKPKPAHCPFCYQRFSASFNAKMHFKGRLKHSGKHISCPVSSKLRSDAINLEPIACAGTNCSECLKRQCYGGAP